MMNNNEWYAVQNDEYTEWDNGSYDLDKAFKMAAAQIAEGETGVKIAVIVNGDYCDREITGEDLMDEITVYVARSADDNSDSVNAFDNKADARKYAEMLAAHLTKSERKTHTVSVETYTFTAPKGMTAAAAYDWGLNEDVVPYDPEDYEEV